MNGEMLIDILMPAMTRDNTEEGDYKDAEGLLVCGKCNTRKQTYFAVEGLIKRSVVPCMCRCEQDKKAAEDAERKRMETMNRISDMRSRGLTDDRLLVCTFDADDNEDEKASRICKRYVEKWEWVKENNAGLMLYGDVGGGKTFLAACIANAMIDRGTLAVMTSIQQLTAQMAANYGEERGNILSMVANVPLLILDDVGAERNTAYGLEQAYEIVNTRYKAKKPLIVTTNITMQAMKSPENVDYRRLYDRIVEMCTPVKVSGAGRRQSAARVKMANMMKEFGID